MHFGCGHGEDERQNDGGTHESHGPNIPRTPQVENAIVIVRPLTALP